jgi:hypothetical protein
MQHNLDFQVLMRSQNLYKAQKWKFFTAEVIKMGQKQVTNKFFFILDFGYASKPKNSASDAMHYDQCQRNLTWVVV